MIVTLVVTLTMDEASPTRRMVRSGPADRRGGRRLGASTPRPDQRYQAKTAVPTT